MILRTLHSSFGATVVLLGTSGIAGCSLTPTLTVSSTPDGAYITEGAKAYGIAPVTISYDPRDLVKHKDPTSGCYLVRGLTAHWVSGATASLEKIKLCGSRIGAYTITYAREPSGPGFAQDMQFALQVEQTRAMKKQAAAAQDAADAAWHSALNPPSFSCTSTQGALTDATSAAILGPMNLAGKDYFTIPEAAAYCCISETHFREKTKLAGLAPGSLWGKLVYRKCDLARLIESEIKWPPSISEAIGRISTGLREASNTANPLDKYRNSKPRPADKPKSLN